MIHDSYGTHANNCDLFGDVLRGVFRDMFTLDLLGNLRHQVTKRHPDIAIKPPPPYGAMKVGDVIKSEYFFC
jgi:DNA-directed RNA polymerase